MKIETVIQKPKNIVIVMNINTGTKIVWHYCLVNSAVVLITIIPIRILRMQHISTKKEMPAIVKAMIAIVLRSERSSISSRVFIFILPYEVNKNTTPRVIIPAKYSTITEITKQPPQALTKSSKIKDKIKVMKTMESEIGQVVLRSAID